MQSKMISTVMLMLLPLSASAVDIANQKQKLTLNLTKKSDHEVPNWMASIVGMKQDHVYPKSEIQWTAGAPHHVYPKSKIQWPPARDAVSLAKPEVEKKEDEKEEKKDEISNSAAKVPFGDLEAFGREDTAKELTEVSRDQSNAMVDQLERAEVAEEKRSVFRALTRLRGVTITSFDGIAKSQVNNIVSYAKKNKFREQHPLKTLAEEESDVSKWAFPNKADFLQMNHTSFKKK
eukprot:TRINITY_DN1422_c0_g1_i1.p1 TRINITY_DN1422_c0_g1~~TRINITY_DN1422_c0_g1_i1.p1  ORF type:complete len:234 (+),score=64.59 TRINITY_DN1422_c0_g1_i1:120-821(+)